MKITLLNGALPHYDQGLSKVIKMVTETLSELSVEVNETNLALNGVSFYDGIKTAGVEKIVKEIGEADGVVLAAMASPHSTGAPLQALLEHFEYSEFAGVLRNKNCMILVVYRNGGGRQALEYYANVVHYMGGFDSVRLCVSSDDLLGEEVDESIKEIVEKQVEDYYRIIRQNRKFFIPDGGNPVRMAKQEGPHVLEPKVFQEEYQSFSGVKPEKKKTVSEVYQKLNLDQFTHKQEQDINEITQFFAQRYAEPEVVKKAKVLHEPLQLTNAKVVPRDKTCLQMTSSLPHYFQPQMAGGVNETIQLQISGNETFEGYIVIQNTECNYYEGHAETPDITIISQDSVWVDVLKGKRTAQKAFMVGQLKVRGNFVLLTKFDQLFKNM